MKMQIHFRIDEVSKHSGASTETILHYVEQSWITPLSSEDQIFDEEDVARIRLIGDLINDFGVNDEAVPLILHLVDQLHRLHRDMNSSRK